MSTSRLDVLSREECLALLRLAKIGRVGLTVRAIPEILPVHFCLIDDAIVFRAANDTSLHTASQRAILAFEADEFDVDDRQGWSVLVVGPSSELIQAEQIETARRELADDWVTGDHDRVLRITPQRVSGRRLTAVMPG